MSQDFKDTLYTVDKRGRRRWVYSSLTKGAWYWRRAIVAYALILFFLVTPWVYINGKQAIWLDFTGMRFTFFGLTLYATDTLFLFLFLAFFAICLFFFTALFGRIWCGWACPETVFLEFVFRPIERLIEGSGAQRLRLDQSLWTAEKIRKKLLKHLLCAGLSWVIATCTLAYVIGSRPLVDMIIEGPLNHLGPFSMTLILMALMAFQFGWFREQFCTVVCPYARFQSVMMDSDSIVVGYDPIRGEPRGKPRRSVSKSAVASTDQPGDCVDCGLCVRVCPTGIDIRNGMQMECIACTACIDACDSIMKKLQRPTGLIRYDTESQLKGESSHFLRPRVFIYAFILIAFLSIFIIRLATRELSEAQLLRGALDAPFSTLTDGRVSNHLHLRIINKSELEQSYYLSTDAADVELITPLSPFIVAAGQVATTPVFLNFNPGILAGGKKRIQITVKSGSKFSKQLEITVVGPGE